MSSRLVIKDAARQLIGRIISALFGFLTIKIITPYLGPLGYGDYSTILKYFAIWTALADMGIYVLAVRRLGEIKEKDKDPEQKQLKSEYGKFVGTRVIIMTAIYTIAIIVAYFLPAYTSNQYLIRGLPFGMIFSASFMFAGIQQLPLQIFRKMEQLSISLITARISQIIILVPVVYLIFKNVNFETPTTFSILAFCGVLFSVVASGIGQNIEIHRRANKLLPLKIDFDRQFTKKIIKRNWKYGVSYYLSSFHTLIVLLFLGWFFPTSSGHNYSGIRALSLSLIEILLIIPSSLGNSMLHKISGYNISNKLKSLGSLMNMMIWIGGIIMINFAIFSENIIRIVSGKEFLGTFNGGETRGSDQILPFLGVVLFLSFIKQVYNYILVATDKQNILLPVNFVGVLIGTCLAFRVIPKYHLVGGVIIQTLIEVLFVVGVIIAAKRHQITPTIQRKRTFTLLGIITGGAMIGYFSNRYFGKSQGIFIALALIINGAIFLISLPTIKKIARGLTIEETQTETPEINTTV